MKKLTRKELRGLVEGSLKEEYQVPPMTDAVKKLNRAQSLIAQARMDIKRAGKLSDMMDALFDNVLQNELDDLVYQVTSQQYD